MKIRTEKGLTWIALKMWRGGWSAGYEPDCFDDMEVNFRLDHWNEETGEIMATEEEVKELVEWWEDEVAVANAGEHGDALVPLTAEEIEYGDEWCINVYFEELTMLFRTDKRKIDVNIHMWDADKHEWDTSFPLDEKALEDAYSIVGFFAQEVKDSDWIYAPTWWECSDEDLTDFLSWWAEECKNVNNGDFGDEALCNEACDFDPEGGDYFELSVNPVDDDGDYLNEN